jgi:hypothetical protein
VHQDAGSAVQFHPAFAAVRHDPRSRLELELRMGILVAMQRRNSIRSITNVAIQLAAWGRGLTVAVLLPVNTQPSSLFKRSAVKMAPALASSSSSALFDACIHIRMPFLFVVK